MFQNSERRRGKYFSQVTKQKKPFLKGGFQGATNKQFQIIFSLPNIDGKQTAGPDQRLSHRATRLALCSTTSTWRCTEADPICPTTAALPSPRSASAGSGPGTCYQRQWEPGGCGDASLGSVSCRAACLLQSTQCIP